MNLWTETDILYAMFLLKANCLRYETTIILLEEMETLCEYVTFHYADLFADRGIAEDEHEGWVNLEAVELFDSNFQSYFYLSNMRDQEHSEKIKFRFVEDE